MGMFDYIKIDQKLLPYVENIKPHLFENVEWQTKSLEKCLFVYQITENGLIEIGAGDEYFKNDFEQIEIENFHGIIRFYTCIDKVWFQFDAKFIDGKLVSVINSVDNQDIKSNDKFFKK